MGTPLNILLAEDSMDDAALLLDALESAGYAVTSKRVENEPDFRAALNARLDVIFSDFRMPRFSVERGLVALRESGLDIPFIVVSGTIGEEQAVECVKSGATDYMLKDNLQRLELAIE